MKRIIANFTLIALSCFWLIPLAFIYSPAAMPWWGNTHSAHVHNYPVALTILVYLAGFVVVLALLMALIVTIITIVQWCLENK